MWKKVTSAEEVKNGDRVRYRTKFTDWFGNSDNDPRFVDIYENITNDIHGICATSRLFDGIWSKIEVWIEDAKPVVNRKEKTHQSYFLFDNSNYVIQEGDESLIWQGTRKPVFRKVSKSDLGKKLKDLNQVFLIRRKETK
jgi:hypothetical protein